MRVYEFLKKNCDFSKKKDHALDRRKFTQCIFFKDEWEKNELHEECYRLSWNILFH